jgi:hypothetical protein
MITVVLLLLFAVIGVLIWGYEKYKKQNFIAKAIDGSGVSGNFLTEEAQGLITLLKQPGQLRLERYTNTIRFPDGQRLSYRTDDFSKFKNDSNLNFEPTPTEWEVLKGVVKKLYSSL